jgi:hypothetical protein
MGPGDAGTPVVWSLSMLVTGSFNASAATSKPVYDCLLLSPSKRVKEKAKTSMTNWQVSVRPLHCSGANTGHRDAAQLHLPPRSSRKLSECRLWTGSACLRHGRRSQDGAIHALGHSGTRSCSVQSNHPSYSRFGTVTVKTWICSMHAPAVYQPANDGRTE